jgi:hypothetical protein
MALVFRRRSDKHNNPQSSWLRIYFQLVEEVEKAVAAVAGVLNPKNDFQCLIETKK